MKTYEALADAFCAEGTAAVYGVMGATNQHWVNAIARLGISFYAVRHEGPSLAMAESSALITGVPGVCTTTSGPGVTQLATAMIAANRSKTPLVAFCGDERWGSDQHTHALDHARFAAAMECEFVRCTSPANAHDAVQRAFYLAQSKSRPVMFSTPLDVQMAEFDDFSAYVTSSALLDNAAIVPNPDVTEIAANIIEASDRVVIVVGRGAMRSDAGDLIMELGERTGALITTSLMAMNWPSDAKYHVGVSGLFSTRAAMELFQDADCVIAVGASLNQYTIEHGYLYPKAKFIQIDVERQVIMGDGRTADCYIQSDARLALGAINALLTDRAVQHIGYRTPETDRLLDNAFDDPQVYEIEPNSLDVREVCRVLDRAIPNDIGLIISGAHVAETATMLFRSPRPFIINNKYFGSMGKGVAAAIGAAVASGHPVALVEGDAGFMMYLSEFDTAVRYGLPVLFMVLNDQALGAELHHHALTDPSLDPALTLVPSPDLGRVGVDLGGAGHLVSSIEGLESAVEEFFRRPQPTLLDIRISRAVESIPVRRLHGHEEI